jgi:hypothetical protein
MSFTTTAYLTPSAAQVVLRPPSEHGPLDQRHDEQEKTAALFQATKAIDRLQYAGVRWTDFQTSVLGLSVTAQSLEFPRVTIQLADPANNPPTTPEDVLIACCLIALALLDGVDPEIEMQNIGTVSQGFAQLRETYDPVVIREAFRAGIPSAEAWNYLLPYLKDPREISFRRV